MNARYVVVAALIFAVACCSIKVGILHEGPQTQKIKTVRLKPEVRVTMNRLDRIEIFAGGIHVGTVILDGAGGIFIGPDPTQAAAVTRELLRMLEMQRVYEEGQNPDRYL